MEKFSVTECPHCGAVPLRHTLHGMRSLLHCSFRARLLVVYAVLVFFSATAWVWAFCAFRGQPGLLSMGLTVYCLGLRHAVDADHIAAIDNVTRNLMQSNRRPVTIGFFFALGHSTVVVLVTAVVIVAANYFAGIQGFEGVGGTISTIVSACFLLAIAWMNIFIFVGLCKAYRSVRAGNPASQANLDQLLANAGIFARLVRPMVHAIRTSWHMFPLGFLFGLGFDTATEVVMFGISARQVGQGVTIGASLVFPLLFAAGMTLVDTTDGIVMLGVYEWAFVRPIRKIYYNMLITMISIVAALLIASIEAVNLIGNFFHRHGSFWNIVVLLNNHFNEIGVVIIVVFAITWISSFIAFNGKKFTKVVS